MKKPTLPILGLLLLSWLTASGQRVEVSTGLPGLLSGLSVGDGGGAVTNLKFPQTYWFTNQGTTTNWTIPTGARALYIGVVGHGGAGGSGRRYASGTIASGGGGGGGGAYSDGVVGDTSLLWTNSLAIVIPSLRTGGGAVVTDDSNGTNGQTATYTYVYVGAAAESNILCRALGGSPGVGGDGDGSAGGSGGAQGIFIGSSGGASSTTGAAGTAGTQLTAGIGGSGGGGGGGITTAPAPSAGGAGALGPYVPISGSVAPAGGIASNGTNYNSNWRVNIVSFQLHGWPGAGGGGSSTNSVGGNGADGYGWGSGGGGGGASLNGFNSGAGGAGGPSAVSITAY